jgi:hypothetical protein
MVQNLVMENLLLVTKNLLTQNPTKTQSLKEVSSFELIAFNPICPSRNAFKRSGFFIDFYLKS